MNTVYQQGTKNINRCHMPTHDRGKVLSFWLGIMSHDV
jgi:hypothetical protein